VHSTQFGVAATAAPMTTSPKPSPSLAAAATTSTSARTGHNTYTVRSVSHEVHTCMSNWDDIVTAAAAGGASGAALWWLWPRLGSFGCCRGFRAGLSACAHEVIKERQARLTRGLGWRSAAGDPKAQQDKAKDQQRLFLQSTQHRHKDAPQR
jgi:hypothetical protein